MFTGIIEELGTVESSARRRALCRSAAPPCSATPRWATASPSTASASPPSNCAPIRSPPTSPRRPCSAATWATCAPARASTWSARSRRRRPPERPHRAGPRRRHRRIPRARCARRRQLVAAHSHPRRTRSLPGIQGLHRHRRHQPHHRRASKAACSA